MPTSREMLLYIDPKSRPRDFIDKKIENAFLLTVDQIETGSTERFIPPTGPLVIGFAPHCGWIEPPAINNIVDQIREDGKPAVWVTRRENKNEVPTLLMGDRKFIFMDRENPQPSTVRSVKKILINKGVIASAFEGTRYGTGNRMGENPDLLALGQFKEGLVRFAYENSAPIQGVVVAGAENIIPEPEKIIQKYGKSGLILRLIKKALEKDVKLQLRFLPPYTAHLSQKPGSLHGEEKHDFINHHTDILARMLIGELIKIKPGYPLGYGKQYF